MMVKVFYVGNKYLSNQCYLIHENNKGLLIDPAWNFDLINNYLISNKIELLGVLLTHSHNDHTNLAHLFSEKYSINVFLGYDESIYYKFNCPNLRTTKHLLELSFGDFNVLPILTPGHTTGSMCYLIGENLFTGDTVFIEGVGICVGSGSDPNQMYDSIVFLKSFLTPNIIIWPGHSYGEETGRQFEYLLKNNLYLQFEKREHFVNFRMRKNQPILDKLKFLI